MSFQNQKIFYKDFKNDEGKDFELGFMKNYKGELLDYNDICELLDDRDVESLKERLNHKNGREFLHYDKFIGKCNRKIYQQTVQWRIAQQNQMKHKEARIRAFYDNKENQGKDYTFDSETDFCEQYTENERKFRLLLEEKRNGKVNEY